jgi:hypothetical protein
MAAGPIRKQDLFGDYALVAIRDRIMKDTFADLKARVMAVIEPEIDAACNRAVQSLEPQLHAHVDLAAGASILKIITTKRSP